MIPEPWRFVFGCVGCATLVIGSIGCTGSAELPGPEPHAVRGKLVYHGKPAEGFRVVFNPLNQTEGPTFAPSAITDANGKFQLQSYGENDGAPAGDYAVTFQWPEYVSTGDPDDAPREVDRLRGALNNPQASKFKVTVKEGENSFEPFVLQ